MSKPATYSEFCKSYELAKDSDSEQQYDEYYSKLNMFNHCIAKEVTKDVIENINKVRGK